MTEQDLQNLKLSQNIKNVYKIDAKTQQKLPLFTAQISAGFPSPADDFIDKSLDVNDLLIKNPSSTFFVRVEGESMQGAGIFDGDLLVVDRSLPVQNLKIVIAVVNGELTVKRLKKQGDRVFLMAENPKYKPLEITNHLSFETWGVVTYVIHQV